jgi:hypothetical protein
MAMRRIPKEKALSLLEEQIKPIAHLKVLDRNNSDFNGWWQKTRMILANVFGQDSLQVTSFLDIDYSLRVITNRTPPSAWQDAYVNGLQSAEALLDAQMAEVKMFWDDGAQPTGEEDAVSALHRIFDRFHQVARQIRSRHSDRPTLNISDEYDVQDLLHGLLRLHFDDIRPEEWTPSYAGAASRIDFVLSEHGIVVEVKKSSAKMTSKSLGDQLLTDIMRYKSYPLAKILFCFVYDPEGYLPNPMGIERDLSRVTDNLRVECFIRPK